VDLAETTVTTIIQTPSETEVEVLDPDTNEPTGDTKIEYSYTYSTPTVNLVAKEGDGDGKNVYYIDSAADLYGLMYLVNGMYKISYSQEFTEIDNETGEEKTVTKSGTVAIPTQHLKGKVIKMTADITVNNGDASAWTATQIKGLQPWMPIGLQHSWGNAASTRVFEGEFDGQGHTVSGIYVNGVWGQFKDKNFTNGAADARQLGFFGHVYEAKVHDFSFVNAMLYTDPTVASNTNEGNALIDKCERSEVYNIYSNATQYGETRLAGIAGYTQDKIATEAGKTKIYNCIYDGTLYVIKSGANSANVGGIVGVAEGNSSYKTTVTVEITDCLVTGTIVYLNSTSKGVTGCGSILGASSNTAAKVTNCVSNVTVVNNCFTAEVAKGMKAMAGGTTTISNSVWNSASMPVGVAAQTGATAKDSLIGYKMGLANWTDRPLDIPVPTAAWKLMNKQFDAAKLVFVQETDVTTIEHADGNYEGYTVRLVSEIRDITATEAGFEILVDSEFVNLGGSTTAYKALNAKEEGTGRIAQVKADANTYFSALEINVATGEEISFTVRPYIVIEGETSYGTAYTITYSADGSFLGAVMANK